MRYSIDGTAVSFDVSDPVQVAHVIAYKRAAQSAAELDNFEQAEAIAAGAVRSGLIKLDGAEFDELTIGIKSTLATYAARAIEQALSVPKVTPSPLPDTHAVTAIAPPI